MAPDRTTNKFWDAPSFGTALSMFCALQKNISRPHLTIFPTLQPQKLPKPTHRVFRPILIVTPADMKQ